MIKDLWDDEDNEPLDDDYKVLQVIRILKQKERINNIEKGIIIEEVTPPQIPYSKPIKSHTPQKDWDPLDDTL